MDKLIDIKNKILNTDYETFKNLCEFYIKKIGYDTERVVEFRDGQKTAMANPLGLMEKYVFVHYTDTDRDIFEKIFSDIKKCLDVSNIKISHDKISEIIYFHKAPNMDPSGYNKLKKFCKNLGIKFTVFGINKLSRDIYLFHMDIAKEYLKTPVSKSNLMSLDEFVSAYNDRKMASPVDTKFLFRENEMEILDDYFSKSDIVMLVGSPGVGKTRLALHFAKYHSEKFNEKVYCIQSANVMFLSEIPPGDYFILIDDANHLSDLTDVLKYTNMKDEGYNVKVIITVRNYAVKKTMDSVKKISNCVKMNIDFFEDDKIKKMATELFSIRDDISLDKIAQISQGNPRVAIFLSNICIREHSLYLINNMAQLYDYYYSDVLENIEGFYAENMHIIVGIMAFLSPIDLDNIDYVQKLLDKKNINSEEFIFGIKKLHDAQIIDIYDDGQAVFSDRHLSDFAIKFIFYDKKMIKLSDMVKYCFEFDSKKTEISVHKLVNMFNTPDVRLFVEDEIRFLWDEICDEHQDYFFEFVKSFYRYNQRRALVAVKNRIDSEEPVDLKIFDVDMEKGKNYIRVSNDIIKILGGYADSDYLDLALDLFFDYYFKRPDLYVEFYHAANMFYGVNKESALLGYYPQIIFLSKLAHYSEDMSRQELVIFFFDLAKQFLKFKFHVTNHIGKNKVKIYDMQIEDSEGVKQYRKIIWDNIEKLSRIGRYKIKIRDIFDSYGCDISEKSRDIMQDEMPYVKTIFEETFSTDKIYNCILANRIKQMYKSMNIKCEKLFVKYLIDEKFLIYRIFETDNRKDERGVDENYRTKQRVIERYIMRCDFKMLKKLIDVCAELSNYENVSWGFRQGFFIAFDTMIQKTEYFSDIIRYYIEKDTPFNIYPDQIIKTLHTLMPDEEVFEIINSHIFSQQNQWLYVYYRDLPKEYINEKNLNGLYDFLEETTEYDVKESKDRDLEFLDKYEDIDKNVFINGCRIIFSKARYSKKIFSIYFGSLFNEYCNNPKYIIKKFEDDIYLLEDIYFEMLSYNDNRYANDYNGEFLKEVYRMRPSVLDRYIDYLLNERYLYFRGYKEKNKCFFDLDDYIEIYNKIFDALSQKLNYSRIYLADLLETILLSSDDKKDIQEKQDKFIIQCIEKYYLDKVKMYCLFSVIAKFESSRRRTYVKLFLENNDSLEDFENIPLTPTTWSWVGSSIPTYYEWVLYLNSIEEMLEKMGYDDHREYVQILIMNIKDKINREEVKKISEI